MPEQTIPRRLAYPRAMIGDSKSCETMLEVE